MNVDCNLLKCHLNRHKLKYLGIITLKEPNQIERQVEIEEIKQEQTLD